jgi:hypothetical protein
MVLAPVIFIHDCVAHASVFVDDVDLMVANGVLPYYQAYFSG